MYSNPMCVGAQRAAGYSIEHEFNNNIRRLMMPKICFVGAGSSVFAKNVLGDAMLLDSLHHADIALYDIDAERLEDSKLLIEALNRNCNEGRATISAYLGVDQRRAALSGADYVVNAIQVGGYEPCTVTDFEVPKKYGLQQTIGDTLGVGGIFRSLRTIPVMLEVARDMEAVCPDAWLLNYTNPMCMITGGILRGSSVKTVGLCHSVQGCARWLLRLAGLEEKYPANEVKWEIAGINHQAWLLALEHQGVDIYPEVRTATRKLVDELQSRGAGKWMRELATRIGVGPDEPHYNISGDVFKAHKRGKASLEEVQLARVGHDLTRLELMFRFGHYVTESSEHNAEYVPWIIKKGREDLLNQYVVPVDEYPRRCREQIANWAKQREALLADADVTHGATKEFGAYIMDAIERDVPFRIAGNVMNDGLITNLPRKACVEVPCLVDRNGVQPTVVGDLPEQCAALNRTNINPQILTVEAALSGKKDYVYQAALLDPHTSAELSIDETIGLCDDMIAAHGDWLPKLT
jgi:alpha-galactosidase